MAKMLVVIEVGGHQQAPIEVAGDVQWAECCRVLRSLLRKRLFDGACGSAVVSVHFADERCDHETAGA